MKRSIARWLGVAGVGLATLAYAEVADAALTDAEKRQIVGYVRDAEVARAERVRALIARPDLTQAESAASLSAAYGPVPFDAAREKFTRELLHGAGSEPARGVLAEAIVQGLLARADALVGKLTGAEGPAFSPSARAAAVEVTRIHAFVATQIANAGQPPADGHDASVGIRDDSMRRAAEAYQNHIQRHASWMLLSNPARGYWLRTRGQAAITFAALGRGVLPRHEVSAMLGLKDARRTLFERHGLLFDDAGQANGSLRDLLLRWLDGCPRAAQGIDLVLLSKTPTAGLSALGRVLRVGADPSVERRVSGLWPEDVAPVDVDATSSELAYLVAWQAVRSGLSAKPELRAHAAALAERAVKNGELTIMSPDLIRSVLAPEGSSGAALTGVSPELLLTHVVRLVLLDLPRVQSLALARSLRGNNDGVAQLMLALSVLAPGTDTKQKLWVGEALQTGKVRALEVAVELDGAAVSSFALDKSKVSAKLLADARLETVRLNGKPPALPALPYARLLPEPAEKWKFGAIDLQRLSGGPRGLVVGDGRLVLASAKESKGFDAVAFGASSENAVVRATLTPSGSGGALLLRAQPGTAGYDAIALFVSESPKVAQLVLVDGSGKATELTGPMALPSKESSFAVLLEVKGTDVRGTVGKQELKAKLTRAVGSGRAGVALRGGGRLELRDLSVKR
jgi:hypothetical protein